MNLFTNTSGSYVFLDENNDLCEFNDYKDIPEDFKPSQVIKFVPNIPPPPHSVQDHEVISNWNKLLTDIINKTYGRTSSN